MADSLGCCQKATGGALSAWGSVCHCVIGKLVFMLVHHSMTFCVVSMAAALGMDASNTFGAQRVKLKWIYSALIPHLMLL